MDQEFTPFCPNKEPHLYLRYDLLPEDRTRLLDFADVTSRDRDRFNALTTDVMDSCKHITRHNVKRERTIVSFTHSIEDLIASAVRQPADQCPCFMTGVGYLPEGDTCELEKCQCGGSGTVQSLTPAEITGCFATIFKARLLNKVEYNGRNDPKEFGHRKRICASYLVWKLCRMDSRYTENWDTEGVPTIFRNYADNKMDDILLEHGRNVNFDIYDALDDIREHHSKIATVPLFDNLLTARILASGATDINLRRKSGGNGW